MSCSFCRDMDRKTRISSPISAVGPDDPWNDIVYCEFRCRSCGDKFDAGAQIYRRMDFSGAELEAGAGFASKGARLLARTDHSYSVDKGVFCLEPLLAVRLVFFHAQPMQGFSPPRLVASGNRGSRRSRRLHAYPFSGNLEILKRRTATAVAEAQYIGRRRRNWNHV
jgi:hypothetical protein